MQVDIGNALSSVADPGVAQENLRRLDTHVATAHRNINEAMENGDHGYAALTLPSRIDHTEISRSVKPLANAETVLVCGIGGSALGAATVIAALGDETDAIFLDNVDPAMVRESLAELSLDRTALVAISRSGTTIETLANFRICRDAYHSADVDWRERTVIVTGDTGPLAELADSNDVLRLAVPEGTPGRFSVLSSVGLVPAALAGVDIEELIAGGRLGQESLAPSLFDCPAYAYGTVTHALAERGASVNAVMPYAEALGRFAEWTAQLWAESLGKDGLGQTPVKAMGATDQHSQLQLFRAGPRDKLVTFITPESRPTVNLPSMDDDSLPWLADSSLGALLDAELDATEASLANAGRPSVRVTIDRLEARQLGELLYCFQASCVLAAELAGIDAFTQPAVEWTKNATRSLLRTGSITENDATQTLLIE